MSQTVEVRFTPGPWEVNGDRDDADGLTVEARVGEVAFIAPTTGYAHADIANASLISSAPDMYEALEAVLPFFKRSVEITEERFGMATGEQNDALKKIYDSLKKARGWE